MKTFEKVYYNIITEQSQQVQKQQEQIEKVPTKYQNLLNRTNKLDFDNIFNKNDVFGNQPLKSSKYYEQYDIEDLEIPDSFLQKVELTDDKYIAYLKINGTTSIQYSWQPYQPRTWDYPGCDAGIDDIGNFGFPFYKDPNNKENNQVFEIIIYTEDDQQIKAKFTQLSLKDRYIIFSTIIQYLESDDFREMLNEEIIQYKSDSYYDYYDEDR